MRLDHLLSREPSFVGNDSAWPVVVVSGCFLVPACVRHPWWVVGVGACFWVGHKSILRTSTLSGSRSTPCERPPPVGGGCLRSQPEGFSWVWGVCGGLFVICIVVASIFVLYCFLCFV